MSFSRVVNNLLRRDPWHHLNHPSSLFSVFDHHPFFRPSIPASCAAVFEVPIENTRYYRTLRGNQQQQQQQQSDQNKDPTTSTSNTNNTEVVSNENQNNSRWLNRRDRHRRHNHPLSRYLNDYNHPLSVFSPFNSLFGGFDGFGRIGVAPEMAIDMLSSPSAYTINAAVPGVEKKDISITVEDGILTIKAERKEERKEKYNETQPTDNQATTQTQSGTSTEASNQGDTTATSATAAENNNTANTAGSSTAASADVDDDLQYDYVESSYGTVQRSFTLPDDVDISGLSARHENGVVKITIPRIAEKKVERQQIQIQ